MAIVTLRGTEFETVGELPPKGSPAPDFRLTGADLNEIKMVDFSGQRIVLNIFPSLDTSPCALSVRRFNELASGLENTAVLCVSADLPFAQARFCGAEGLGNVVTGSTFRSSFGEDFGAMFRNGPLAGLLSRSVVVIDTDGRVIHTQQVSETTDEPDYDAALAAL